MLININHTKVMVKLLSFLCIADIFGIKQCNWWSYEKWMQYCQYYGTKCSLAIRY